MRSTHHWRPAALLRRTLLSSLPFLLVACSGGGGGGGGGLAPGSSVQVAGTWNLEREWYSCSGVHRFETGPLEIVDTGNGVDFVVRFGGHEFEGARAGDQLTLSGDSTLGIETLTILDGSLTIGPDGERLDGTLLIDSVTTPFVTIQCEQAHEVRAFRPDSTNQSELLGEWEWTLGVSERSGAWTGDPVGTTTRVPVSIFPQREGRFTADLVTPDGDRLQLDLEESPDALTVLASTQSIGFFPPIEFEVESGDLALDRAARLAVGSFRLTESPEDGSPGSATTYAVDMRREPTGTTYMPVVRDVGGASTLHGVDVDSVELVDLGASVLGTAPTGSLWEAEAKLEDACALQRRGDFDAVAGQVTDLAPHTLYYRGPGGIWALDLAERRDEDGVERPSVPELVVETELADDAQLRCYPVLNGPRGVLTYRTPQGLMMTELGWDGSRATAALPADTGTIHFETFDPETGLFDGLIVRRDQEVVAVENYKFGGQISNWQRGELLRVRGDGTTQVLGLAVDPEIFRGDDGSVWFGPGEVFGETQSAPIQQYDPTTKEVYLHEDPIPGTSRKLVGCVRNRLYVVWRTDEFGANGQIRVRAHWVGTPFSAGFSNLIVAFDDVVPEAGLGGVEVELGIDRSVAYYLLPGSPELPTLRSFQTNALATVNAVVPLVSSTGILTLTGTGGNTRFAGVFGNFLLNNMSTLGQSLALDLTTGAENELQGTNWRERTGLRADTWRLDGTGETHRSVLARGADDLWVLPEAAAAVPVTNPFGELIRLDSVQGAYAWGQYLAFANAGPYVLVSSTAGGGTRLALMHDRLVDSAVTLENPTPGQFTVPVR